MVSSVRSRLNVLVINVLIVTMVVGGSQALALVVTPQGGAYDHNGTPSALKFTVNGAGTRITSGAKVQGGFPCAPKTLITTEKIDIVDGSFSYKGPVVRKSGQPGGTLRWSGTWSSRYDVDGALRVRKGDCRSGKRQFASMAVLPTWAGLTVTGTPGSGQITLEWPTYPAAAGYDILRSADPSKAYSSRSFDDSSPYTDSVEPGTQNCYVLRPVNGEGEALANSTDNMCANG